MNSKQMLICKLCLKTLYENEWKMLERNHTQILEVLLLQVEVQPKEQCVICMNCVDMLQKCFEFKSRCLYVENYISPFLTDGIKIELGEILQENANIDNDNDIKLCRLCIDIIKDDTCKHLDQTDSKNLVDDLKICLPELNISSVYDPVICEKCIKCINEYRNFQKNFTDLNSFNEQKECMNLDLSSNCKDGSIAQNEKFDILQEHNYNLKDNGYGEHSIVVELDEINNATDTEHIRCHDIDTKDEFLETVGIASAVQGKLSAQSCVTTDEGLNDLCNRNKCSEKDSKTFIQKYKYSEGIRIYQCTFCNYETKLKHILEKHMQVQHLDPSERKTFKYSICDYARHGKCYLLRHRLVHKDLSEKNIYKCNNCDFDTKWKNSLKTHESKCCKVNISVTLTSNA